MYANALELAHAHVTETLAVLKEVGARGIRVDLEKLEAFNEECDRQLAALQAKMDADPDLLPFRGFHPKEGYKRTPKDTTGMEEVWFEIPSFEPTEGVDVFKRWAKLKPFLATSSQQVLKYIKAKGHAVAKTKLGDETSGQKALLLAWRKYKDDHYLDFVEFRKWKKLRGTYGKWPLKKRGGDTYATTTYTLRPETNRLSSVNPNLQNIPKKGPKAKLFRQCLTASPGCRLIKSDFGSAEAVILAWMSRDPLLMRLAKLGMHKYVMAKRLGVVVDLNKPDAELKPIFEDMQAKHPEMYDIVKITVYGSFYLAGPRTLYEKNPEVFTGMKEAKEWQTLLFNQLPAIRTWQQSVVYQKAKWTPETRWGWIGNRLINPFGYSIEYWDLRGSDGPAACAWGPQSTIGSTVKECMLQLRRMEAGKYMNMQIHDELVFDAPLEKVELVRQQVLDVMGQPWPQMHGLAIPVEIKVVEHL